MTSSNMLWEKLLAEIQRLQLDPSSMSNLGESDAFVSIVARAYLNPVYISWDIETFAESAQSTRKRFPSPKLGHIKLPATIVDRRGRILIWYLPGCLTTEEQNKWLAETAPIIPEMAKKVKDPNPKKCVNWRINRETFVPAESSRSLPHGVETYSAGWFAQGHVLPGKPLKPSRSMHSLAAKKWLKRSAKSQQKINRILSLIHPKLFTHGMRALAALRSMPLTRGAAKRWASAFSGIAVMSNRRSIPHRDRNGSPPWYDMLVSLGSYKLASLDFPELGLSLAYPPGTGVALCGNILVHKVNSWGAGDRVCYAMFFRKAVLNRLGADGVGWSTRSRYQTELSI